MCGDIELWPLEQTIAIAPRRTGKIEFGTQWNVASLVQRIKQRRRALISLRRYGGNTRLQRLGFGAYFTDVLHVIAVAQPPRYIRGNKGERAGGDAAPTQPLELAFSREVTTRDEVLLKDHFLQQVLKEKTLTRSSGCLCGQHFAWHAEGALHGTQHAIKRRAFLCARRKVHTTHHRLFGKL